MEAETKMTAIPSQEELYLELGRKLTMRAVHIDKLNGIESFMDGWKEGTEYMRLRQKHSTMKVSVAFVIRHTDKLIGTAEYWHEDTIPCEFFQNIARATRYETREEAEEAGKIVRRNHNGIALEIVQILTTTSQIEATELPR